MLDSFLYSFNAIFPIFALVALGMFLKKIRFLDENYCRVADKLVFNVALPVNLFFSVSGSDLDRMFGKEQMSLVLFCVCGITLFFILLCIITPVFIKDRAVCGSFIQGAFRSNYAIFALPLITNMFGDAGKETASALMPFVVILLNVYAVICLSFYHNGDVETSGKKTLKRIIKSTVRNPLIIGNVVGVVFLLLKKAFGFSGMPTFLSNTLNSISSLAVPLALISIGVSFRFSDLRGRAAAAVIAASLRIVVFPLAAVLTAVALGMRGVSLSAVLVVFGAPTAVASYVMSKEMGGDAPLSSQILLISTSFCLFTMFSFVFVLKYLQLF